MAEPSVRKKSILIACLISFITVLLIVSLDQSDFFKTYELKSMDLFQRFHSPLENPEVLMVEIDQQNLTALSEKGIQWPWPRQIYAPLIEFCAKAGSKGIIFDIIFSEPSSYGKEDDRALAEAIQEARSVFLPMSLSSKPAEKQEASSLSRFGLRHPESTTGFREARSFVLPVPEFVAGVRGLGNVILSPGSDGVYRAVALFTRLNESLFPSLTVAPLLDRVELKEGKVFLDGKVLFLNREGQLMLHFYGKDFQFPRLSALDILSVYQSPEDPLFEKVRGTVKDRYIIVALTAPGLYDLKPPAVTSVSPGAYVHGILLTNLLNGDHLREVGGSWKYALMFLLGSVLGYAILETVSFWKNTVIFLLYVLGWPALSLALFFTQDSWIGFLSYEIAFFLVFGMTSTYSYNTEGKKRRVIRQLFSCYMSEVLVKELESNPQKARLGGDRRFITIFFSDLANFTTLSERFEPERIVSLLNEYFTEMSQVILESQGVIDKYQGDGIMAFWGAPIALKDHATRACLAALECQVRMGKINQSLSQEGIPPLSMRIGLHSGDAVVGNMGSAQRFDYTIIGDNVNLASRLEGVNKQFGTKVIISETTYAQAMDGIEARELDLIAVKGKEKPIRIYELLGEKGGMTEEQKKWKLLYEEALRRYWAKDFAGARRLFAQVLETNPEDHPAALLLKRCEDLQENAPAAEWDGVFRLKQK
jgi:adenylate cyclase